MDPREFDRRVLESIDPICGQIRPDQLSLVSPCTGWDLGDLFGTHVEVAQDAPIDQKLMAYLGRDPGWTAA